MMSEIGKIDMSKLVGRRVTVFNRKNYRFTGKVTHVDSEFLELFDEVKSKTKIIKISEVSEIEY